MEEYLKNINFNNYKNVKIDIGLSHDAPMSRTWLYNSTNDLLVIGFEPNINSIESVKRRTPNNINNNFFIIPVALHNTDTKIEKDYYVTGQDWGTSSLYKPLDERLGPVNEIYKVPVYSLKHLFDIFPWNKFEYIDYIKVDAQGSDLDILKGAGKYLNERVVYVTAEPDGHQYESAEECNEKNIDEYMKSQNFMRIQHPYTKDPTYLNNKFYDLKDKIFIFQR
jgi:FkbM family methyltransferase